MTVEVTLSLSEALIEDAKKLGSATQRDLEAVLQDTLEILSLTWESVPSSNLYPPVSSLTDEEVISLANLKLSESQNQRLGDLQAKGKSTGISEIERYELLALLQIYQIGQLRKSEALLEAVKRGLYPPLPCHKL
jgi:hypothetical protein